MTDLEKLIDCLVEQENSLQTTQFIAPCVKGGRVRTRVAGMVYTFAAKLSKFEGWGIFQPVDAKTAEAIEEADFIQISEYLQQFPAFRLRLAYRLKRKTWLAYPINEADVRQRSQQIKPVVVHLVSEGSVFEQIIARFDGQAWWFEELDRRSEIEIVDRLKENYEKLTLASELRFKGITPEMRTVYHLATQHNEAFLPHLRAEKRLQKALEVGGGQLQQFHDRGDYWTVEWTTADGENHTSAIGKNDLTVISSGICLSGRDRDFDLQSLVGVMEEREW
jgi:hypothetical protein